MGGGEREEGKKGRDGGGNLFDFCVLLILLFREMSPKWAVFRI